MNNLISSIGISGVLLLAAFGLGALLTKLPKWLTGTLALAGVLTLLTPVALTVIQTPQTSCYEDVEDSWIYDEEEEMPWFYYEDEDTSWDYYEDIPQNYYYSGNTMDGKTIIDFSISLYPDGTYTWYETPISSTIGIGTYEIEDDILTMTDDVEYMGIPRVNRFLMTEDSLIFIEEGSSNFPFVRLEDGEEFFYEKNPVEEWMEKWED